MGLVFNKVSYYDTLSDITFTVDDSKITGIVGMDTDGLSELFDLLTFEFQPTKGNIIGNYSKVGYVSYSVNDQFFYDIISDEFYFILKMNRINSIKRVHDSLLMMGLDDSYLSRSIYSLSSSELKKVRFACALSINPDFLVLYEPFMGLDKGDRDNIIRLLLMMKNKYSKTIVIISKDTDILLELCDETIVISDGTIVRTGDKYSIFSDNNLLLRSNLSIPKTIEFSKLVLNKKKIDIGYRDNVNDLIKDIFRFVR